MALAGESYELDGRKESIASVQLADEDGLFNETGRSKSLSSRDERDRAELIRLGKNPVLKVCY
jgi:hypothetical protein